MRDVRCCGRGLGTSWSFVPYKICRSQERTSLGCNFIKTSTVFCDIALVFAVFVDHSVLLSQSVWTAVTAGKS